jgi:hypothetical protein
VKRREMMKNKKIIIVLILISLILLSNIALAFPWILLFKDFAAAFAGFLVEKAQRMAVAGIVQELIFSPLSRATNDLPKLILLNPEIMIERQGEFVGNPPVESMVNFMISIIIPFYIFGIISIAFYLLFIAGSPMGRARAKAGLLKLLVSIPIIFLTIPIIQLFIDISEYLTTWIFSLVNVEVGIMMLKASIDMLRADMYSWIVFSYWPALRHPANVIMFGMPIFIMIFMRYFAIIVYTIMFPLIIFMYAFKFVGKLGEAMFKQIIWWTFSQVMMAAILVGISITALSLPFSQSEDPMLHGCFGLGGFVALAVAPLITMMITSWGGFIGMVRDLMYTPWISLGASTIGMGVETMPKEEVSPPPPIGPPRIPPPPTA